MNPPSGLREPPADPGGHRVNSALKMDGRAESQGIRTTRLWTQLIAEFFLCDVGDGIFPLCSGMLKFPWPS